MIKVALWYDQSGTLVGQSDALVDQSGALGGQSGALADQSGALVDQSGTLVDQSGTLVWSKWRFDVMQAHFGWTLKNDSSSLANSETKAPSKCLSKCLSKCRPLKVFKALKMSLAISCRIHAWLGLVHTFQATNGFLLRTLGTKSTDLACTHFVRTLYALSKAL